MEERFIRAAGYLFTWRREAGHTRVDMFREARPGGARYGVASAVSASDDRAAVYATALAMVGWVRSLAVAPRRTVKATAVAECLAVLCDRVRQAEASGDPQRSLVLQQVLDGRVAAA